MQRDPIGYADSANLELYARSSPSRFTDPNGLQSIPNLGTAEQLQRLAAERTQCRASIAMRIMTILARRIARGPLVNRISNALAGNLYELQDDNNELATWPGMYAYMTLTYRTLLKAQRLTPGVWTDITVYPLSAKRLIGNEFKIKAMKTFDTAWWLNGPHDVIVAGKMSACLGKDKVLVRNLKMNWEWHDEIDGKSYGEMRSNEENEFATSLEGTYDVVVDKYGAANFNIIIYFKHEYDSREFYL
jgi:hypothetical protein